MDVSQAPSGADRSGGSASAASHSTPITPPNGMCVSNDSPIENSQLVQVSGNPPTGPAQKPSKMIPAILFGRGDVPDENIIPSQLLRKLPDSVMDNLISAGQVLKTGPLQFLTLDKTWYGSLVNLQSYLEHGDYPPFYPATPLKVVTASGATVDWSAGTDQRKIVRSTDESHAVFREEVAMYVFASFFEYAELRKNSSHRICHSYPVFAREALWLLQVCYRGAEETNDEELCTFIRDSVNKHKVELTRNPDFVAWLRQFVSHDTLGAMVLETYIASNEEARADIFLTKALKEEPKPSAPSPKSDSTAGLVRLHEAISEQKLVVAKRSGFGTLLSEGSFVQRNRDFVFEEGELLLADYNHAAFNGHNNITVINARGQKGDVLRSLLVVVPPSLGIADIDSINVGRASREEDASRMLRSRARLERDNEGRTFGRAVTSERQLRTWNGSSYERSRSRSPPRYRY